MIESLASGRPVLTYDVEWHSEVVKNAINGIIVKKGDIKKACIEISKLLEDKTYNYKLGSAGKSVAFKEFDLDKVKSIRKKEYLRILNAKL